ncbi:hypothetical protein GCM10027073_26590 [Streptomyces chlorus]|uniref:Uncharacterized protein n=1 Tax=Streptomyces chlorus TaxID=887452 RepID=A0ABW1EA11_9ACTN
MVGGRQHEKTLLPIGHLPLPLAVAGHEGSTVLVGINGLRLLRESAWRTGAAQAG